MISKEAYFLLRNNFKNVQLTCKIFEELATPFLLPRVICALLSSLIAILIAILYYLIFSKFIIKVVYIYNWYYFVKTLREYKEALRKAKPLYSKFEKLKSEEENLDLKKAFS